LRIVILSQATLYRTSVSVVFAAYAGIGDTNRGGFVQAPCPPSMGPAVTCSEWVKMTVTTEVFPTIVPRSAAPPPAHLRLAAMAANCPGFAGH
jgi:hypothetical protein